MFKLRILYFYLTTKYLRNFSSRARLEIWQEGRIKSFLTWVRKNSPFYREQMGALLTTEWREMAIVDKKIMMDHFSSLNTVAIDRDHAFEIALQSEKSRDFTPTLNGVTVGLSSGTSGNRGLFLVSDLERARHAGTILAKVLPNSIFSTNRVAFFMRANSNLYTASQSSRLKFEFFDLLTSVEQHLERLDEFNPTLLLAPPSMLIRLAEAQLDGRMKIKPLKIFSIAETLDPLDQKKIEVAFKQKVHQIYQCTEGFLATTCNEGVLHLNEDCVHIETEWLDDTETKFMPIITDFSRTSQPIIRYRLNDILTVKKSPCVCGSVMMALETIEGRADDMLYFLNDANETVAVFPDFIRRAVISASEHLDEYLVTQSEPGHLSISLKSKTQDTQMIGVLVEKEMTALSRTLKTRSPKIKWSTHFPPLEGKKLRRVARLY
jgi:putative adenylate-forming enzyme